MIVCVQRQYILLFFLIIVLVIIILCFLVTRIASMVIRRTGHWRVVVLGYDFH